MNDVAQRSRVVKGIVEAISTVDANAVMTLEVSHLIAQNEALLRHRPEGSSPGETEWLAGMRTLVADFAALRGSDSMPIFIARLTTPLSDRATEHLTAIAEGTTPEKHARAVEEIIALVAELDPGAAMKLSMRDLVARNATLLNERPAAGAPEEAEWLVRIQALAGELHAVSESASDYVRTSFLKQLAAPVTELAREHISALALLTVGEVAEAAEVEAPGSESPVDGVPAETDVARHTRAAKSLIAAVAELDSSAVFELEVELKKALTPKPPEPEAVTEPDATSPAAAPLAVETPATSEPVAAITSVVTPEPVVTPDPVVTPEPAPISD